MILIKIKQFVLSLLSVFLFFSVTMMGYTQDGEIAATASYSLGLKLSAAVSHVSQSVIIDSCSNLSFMMMANSRNLQVKLIAPNGTQYIVGKAGQIDTISGTVPNNDDPLGLATSYLMTIQNPIVGTWVLDILQEQVINNTIYTWNAFYFENSVISSIMGGGNSVVIGDSINLALTTIDSQIPLTNVQISAVSRNLSIPEDVGNNLSFIDDGNLADATANDGIFSAAFSPSIEGEYLVVVRVSGVASTGPFQRSVSCQFKVIRKTASITGNYTVSQRAGAPK